jgi:hypothetical protein
MKLRVPNEAKEFLDRKRDYSGFSRGSKFRQLFEQQRICLHADNSRLPNVTYISSYYENSEL